MVAIWEKVRARNEALDLRVYNEAALSLLNPKLDVLCAALEARAEQEDEEPLFAPDEPAIDKPEAETTVPFVAPLGALSNKQNKKRTRRAGGGFVNRR